MKTLIAYQQLNLVVTQTKLVVWDRFGQKKNVDFVTVVETKINQSLSPNK